MRSFGKLIFPCCGHLSCFTIDGQQYSAHPSEDVLFGPREETMGQKIYNVLGAGTKFQHEYDYGSTTELKLGYENHPDDP